MSRRTEDLTLGEWNAGDRTNAVIEAAIAELFEVYGCDVVVLNEIADRWKVIDRLVGRLDLGVHTGNAKHGGSRREAILWRAPRFIERNYGLEDLAPRISGAGRWKGRSFGPKYGPWVELEDTLTGRTPVFLAEHPVPSLDLPKHAANALTQQTAVASWAEELWGQLFVIGDMNGKWNEPTLRPLRRGGFTCNHQILGSKPTRAKEGIDQVWSRGDFEFVDHEVLRPPRGDHGRLVVHGRLPVARRLEVAA